VSGDSAGKARLDILTHGSTPPLRTPGARARVAVPPVRREPCTVRRRTPGGARS